MDDDMRATYGMDASKGLRWTSSSQRTPWCVQAGKVAVPVINGRSYQISCFLRCGLIVSAMMALSGCAGLVTPPTAFTLYDLGPVTSRPGSEPAIVPGIVEVKAPTWLASNAMQYRLDYRSPASREAFAENRWVGHPAEMLQRLVGASFSDGAVTSGSCRLRIELDEFIQSFDSAERSDTELRARVSLVAPRDELTLATRGFVVKTRATSADAPGGVVAHREGTQQFITAVTDWLETLDREQAEGAMNGVDRCRR